MPSHLRRSWESLRKLPERTPLRVKLVSALLALVAIALTVISVSSLVVFRGYLQHQTEKQLLSLIDQAVFASQHGGPRGPAFSLPGYVVELRDAQGNLVPGFGSWQDLDNPGPAIPMNNASWLTSHAGKLTTVSALSGTDSWRVITKPVFWQEFDPFTGEHGPKQPGTVLAGADLGNIDQTISSLAKFDLVVSLIIMGALAVAGVMAVRASLRPLTDIEQ